MPGVGAERQLARRATAGARPDVALGDEPALDELADALRDDRPAQARSASTSSDRERERPRRISSRTVTSASSASSGERAEPRRGDHARLAVVDFSLDSQIIRRASCELCSRQREVPDRLTSDRRRRAASSDPRATRSVARWADATGSPTSARPSSAPGFIGTVHVEALRRIGVQVRGVLGSTPERAQARADAARRPARVRLAR